MSSTMLPFLFGVLCALAGVEGAQRKNVLFLVSDDMRPDINVYGSWYSPKMHTPSLDALAARSLLLKKAYVQQAVCSPSRTSLLTGRRPDTTHVHDLTHYWRLVAGNFTTIPQYFKQNGYVTAGFGKIFHPSSYASDRDDPPSWTEPYFREDMSYWGRSQPTWHAAPPSEYQAHPLQDQQIADAAVKKLQDLAPAARGGKQPFFVAVGFHRPHLPFIAPKEYFDLYPLESIQLPPNPYAPVGMPEYAWSNFDELRDYPDFLTKYGYGAINTTLPDDVVRNLRRAYYASISFTDSLVGQLVSALDRLGLADSTIVSFWGDHGWQLGEHGEWCKHTDFELATHAPMMVHVPGITEKGIVTERLTEFVDLFPTLAEAAGLRAVPLCPEDSSQVLVCTEGASLLPLMKDPSRPWKQAAFSQYPRMQPDGDQLMGYSLRTDQYRYTEWVRYQGMWTYKPIWSWVKGIELYDHTKDPQENVNRAYDPAYANVQKALHKMLILGWRHAQPPTQTET